ncbi:MAG: hypothetical protein HYR94_22070 [Chloroflexi bacterium]|nr:hypothetical protein [Chloroflexota bacterium]
MGLAQAREFRQTKTSHLTVYRCTPCQGIYNLYSRTVFEGRYFRPAQAVLLLRGVIKGNPSAEIAREIEVSRQTVHEVRQEIQANAQRQQPQTALSDSQTETDEMFQNAGKKGDYHGDPTDPPRSRANKQRGHGPYDNDRPPIGSTVGRQSGQVRLRVVHHTDQKPWKNRFTPSPKSGSRSIPMNGRAIIRSFDLMSPSVTSYALCAAFIKSTSLATSPYVSSLSISNEYLPPSSLLWLLALVLNMSQDFLA